MVINSVDNESCWKLNLAPGPLEYHILCDFLLDWYACAVILYHPDIS